MILQKSRQIIYTFKFYNYYAMFLTNLFVLQRGLFFSFADITGTQLTGISSSVIWDNWEDTIDSQLFCRV